MSMTSTSSAAAAATAVLMSNGIHNVTAPIPTVEGDEVGLQIEVDEAVLAKFLPGSQILSASRHGSTRFHRSAKIVVALPDDDDVRTYLLRASAGDPGKQMMRGEFESHLAIHTALPGFTPQPVGWGVLKSKPGTYFCLTAFHERLSSPSDPVAFCRQLAKLHAKSRSPDGRFGFPTTTYVFAGEMAIERLQTDTWEEYFTINLQRALILDAEINGIDDPRELALREELLTNVVPRLLRPLESGGRKIKPSLVHGDLTISNAGDVEDRGTMLFNPAACYAHHEYELAPWRAVRNGFDARFVRAYLTNKLMPVSEPREDFDDRNALYAVRSGIIKSICFPGSTQYRDVVAMEIKRLVERFRIKPPAGIQLMRSESADSGVAVSMEEEERAARERREKDAREASRVRGVVGAMLLRR